MITLTVIDLVDLSVGIFFEIIFTKVSEPFLMEFSSKDSSVMYLFGLMKAQKRLNPLIIDSTASNVSINFVLIQKY